MQQVDTGGWPRVQLMGLPHDSSTYSLGSRLVYDNEIKILPLQGQQISTFLEAITDFTPVVVRCFGRFVAVLFCFFGGTVATEGMAAEKQAKGEETDKAARQCSAHRVNIVFVALMNTKKPRQRYRGLSSFS